MWFHDLPDHPCIRFGKVPETASEADEDDTSGTKKYTEDEYILKVRRPKLTNPPEPPREIVPWLQKGWQNVDGRVSIEPTIQTSAGGQPQVFRFEDEPRRQRLLEEWINRRNIWEESERPVRIVMTIYERLYALQAQIERETERLELMLGDGLLIWHPQNGSTVHHPVLLLRLQLRFDPEIPEFTLLETGQPSELYTAVLQTMPDIKPAALGRCREDLEQNDWHPLGGEETNSFLRRLISQISPYGELVAQIPSDKQKNIPYITRDPVIFLRPRTLGIGTALEAILETLPVSNSFPSPLINLVGVETYTNAQQAGEISASTIDAPNGEDENILLSKPANADQLEIARRLEKYGAVLVQGPPGTGKTHTIANLIGHLLAQGKRVLVTSEKSKALRVLREKVVEPLQSLCVSMLEDDNREEMKRTIEDISERLAFADADKLEREAAFLTRQRIEVLHQLQKARQQLLEARGSEYREIVLAGEAYRPSDAARNVAREKLAAAWIPSPDNRCSTALIRQ